jgi:lysozyme
MPKTNPEGIALIKSFEGCVLHVYPDPVTGGEPYTAGYGHTGGLHPGDKITQAQADAWLAQDLTKFEAGVNDLCSVSLNTNQFSALVCFAYNVGMGALVKSTLMRLINAGDFTDAAEHFSSWVYAGGRIIPGLVRRRTAEAGLFREPPHH